MKNSVSALLLALGLCAAPLAALAAPAAGFANRRPVCRTYFQQRRHRHGAGGDRRQSGG
ncbi:hypothetical protein M8494_24740 [Serratia ureilytica]